MANEGIAGDINLGSKTRCHIHVRAVNPRENDARCSLGAPRAVPNTVEGALNRLCYHLSLLEHYMLLNGQFAR
jgi:hypothetical protein